MESLLAFRNLTRVWGTLGSSVAVAGGRGKMKGTAVLAFFFFFFYCRLHKRMYLSATEEG